MVLDRNDLAGQSDRVILDTAAAEDRAVITNNVKDFRPLAAERLAQANLTPADPAPLDPDEHTYPVEMLADAIERILREHPAGLPATERWIPPASNLRATPPAFGGGFQEAFVDRSRGASRNGSSPETP